MTFHDAVNEAFFFFFFLAPAVRRFHMRCGVPRRMGTASRAHRRLSGRQNAVNGQDSD